jgi:hypothetical protein
MPNFGFNLLTVQYFRTIPDAPEDVNLGLDRAVVTIEGTAIL